MPKNVKTYTIVLKHYNIIQSLAGVVNACISWCFQMCNIDSNIGTEELAHFEMICAIVYQLTRNLTPEEIKESGFDKYYVDHTLALWPQAAGGIPFNACEFQSKGDVITDLTEDMAADATC